MRRQVARITVRAEPLERPRAGDIDRLKAGLHHHQSTLHLTASYGEKTNDYP